MRLDKPARVSSVKIVPYRPELRGIYAWLYAQLVGNWPGFLFQTLLSSYQTDLTAFLMFELNNRTLLIIRSDTTSASLQQLGKHAIICRHRRRVRTREVRVDDDSTVLTTKTKK